ncbi:uncharacterized protein VTP21DRAFT_3899 [Calcarisporiella thermophila]|uniref:uncharacterized protein n=1 Tax=Calcarisporiella thermophila TaxID=911321 RepID=UPI00374253DB
MRFPPIDSNRRGQAKSGVVGHAIEHRAAAHLLQIANTDHAANKKMKGRQVILRFRHEEDRMGEKTSHGVAKVK